MKYTLLTILSIYFLQATAQQPGTLDESFGEKGKIISSSYEGSAYTSVLQEDSKIVVAGSGGYYTDKGAIGGALLVRYNTDGTLDRSYGDSGRAVINPSATIYRIALQKDGKIIAAVRGYNSFALMRVNENGTIDKSFGDNGLALGPTDNVYIHRDMAVLPDGRIIITGDLHNEINDDNRFFVACFTSEGKLDLQFGENGIVITELSNAVDINAAAITIDSKIIIAGRYIFSTIYGYKMLLLRYSSDGSADQSFGTNGIAEITLGKNLTNGIVSDIAIAGDNTIITAGWTFPDQSVNAAILMCKFREDGSVDSSFGINGYAVTKYENEDARAYTLALQQDKKVIAGGNFVNDGTGGVTTVRYNQDGTVDSTFGENGITKTVFTGDDVGSSLLLQKDGKIVLSGYSGTKDDKLVTTLVRFNGGDGGKQPLIVRIKRWLQHHGIYWQYSPGVRYYSVQRSMDGGITFREVAKVYAANQPFYRYEDAPVSTGNVACCYRLMAVAKDGTKAYSNTLLLDDAQQTRIYPNPVRDNLQLQGLPTSGKTNLSIMDLNGNVRSTATATGTNYSVNTANLNSGSYLLKIQHDNTVTTQPFIKQ